MALVDTYIPMTKNLFFCRLAGINTLRPHVVIATPPLRRHPSERLWGRIVSNRVVLKNIYYGKNIRQVAPFVMCILCEPRYVISLKMKQLNIFEGISYTYFYMSRSKEWWPCLYGWLLSLEATTAIRFSVKTYEWLSTLLRRGLNRPLIYSSYSFHGNLHPIVTGRHIHRLKKKYICEAVT